MATFVTTEKIASAGLIGKFPYNVSGGLGLTGVVK